MSNTRFAATKTVAGAIVVATLVGCALSLTMALIAIRLDQAGFSGHAIGINTAAGGLATLLAAPAIPWAARRLGVANLLLLSLVCGALALFAFTLTEDYVAWLALRCVIGVVVTIDFILSEFWITTWAPEGNRGFAIGLYASSLAAGFAFGPLLLAWIGTNGNWPFLIGTALFAVAAVPLALNARGAPTIEARSRKTLLSFLFEAPGATLAAMLQGAIEVVGMSLLPVFALRAGLSVGDGALFATFFIVGSGAFQMPLGALADRIDSRKLLIGLAVLGALGAIWLATSNVQHKLAFELLLMLWGGIVGALYPVGLSQLAQLYRGADLASGNSTFVMAYAFGMLVGPPVIGLGLDIAPSGYFWAIAALLTLYLIPAGAQLARSEGWRRSFP